MKTKRLRCRYSDEEFAFLEANKLMARKELHASFVKVFGREDVTLPKIKSLCKERGWLNNGGQYEKGNVPWNKNKKITFTPARQANCFQKGRVPHNKAPGKERVSKDGYIVVTIEGMRNGVRKHRLLWEQKHGPIPNGHVLKCKGDRMDADPKNWILIPVNMIPFLNGGRAAGGRDYDRAPAELRPTILAVAKLEYSLRKKAKGNR